MIVQRVSNVEAFRQFENGCNAERFDGDAEELADLLAKLRGEGEESEAMRAGTALHKALEHARPGEVDVLTAMGYSFTFPGDLEIELTPIREIRASKRYIVDGEPIVISGQVDAIYGRRIDDHKTTARFDPDRYLDGYQWRLYLDIFGADVFRWNVFELAEREPMVYEIRAQHRLEQYRYPALGDDCQRLVERFARFVRAYAPAGVAP